MCEVVVAYPGTASIFVIHSTAMQTTGIQEERFIHFGEPLGSFRKRCMPATCKLGNSWGNSLGNSLGDDEDAAVVRTHAKAHGSEGGCKGLASP